MADDGMLINFAADEGPFNAKLSFKGGSWKDRLTAKKAALYRRSKDAKQAASGSEEAQVAAADFKSPPNSSENGPGDIDQRPTKRQRVEQHPNQPVGHASAPRQDVKSSSNSRQVISSLFSFNPESKVVYDEKPHATAAAEPSNAPLKSELETFTSLGLSPALAEHLLRKLQIQAPTAIQRSAISQLTQEDTDAFIQAETGSGKTLAYLLPIVQKIMALSSGQEQNLNTAEHSIHRHSGLFAIIIAPTRELSKQIAVVLESLLRCAHWIVSGIVIGGEKKKSEKARLRKGLNILIATPGRLADHLQHTEVLDTSCVRWVVLDEGDRLMELGFEQDIQRILAKLRTSFANEPRLVGLPSRRTTVLCSATMKTNVQKLGEISLKDAIHIQADVKKERKAGDDKEKSFSAPAQLKQSFAIVPAKLRLVTLVALLKRSFARRGSVMKTIIFISCADSVDFHFEVLSHREGGSTDTHLDNQEASTNDQAEAKSNFCTSAPATAFVSKENPVRLFRLHGSLPQAVRTSTLSAFRLCKDPAVLVCTDVASRGLDLPNVDFVIEYDPPFNKDDHLHRIGRTARAGMDGRAMIFLMPGSEEAYIDILKQGRPDAGRDLTRHDSTELLKKGFASTGLGGGKDWEVRATEWQLNVERWVLNDSTRLEHARRAYQSHIRAYATHVANERHMFDMTTLHLGHLAKAFALRDKPGSIRVPGLRPSKASGNNAKAERAAQAKSAGNADNSLPTGSHSSAGDTHDAARKMRSKMKEQLSGASEFNLG